MAKKFDFLSPGIEIREIDQSFIGVERDAEGPIIIGRTRKGPANKPVKVRNLDDFVSVFGLPVPGGNGVQGDMWRDGNMTGPTYASYAAQAWLASEQSPVTMVRLAGDEKTGASGFGNAGWQLSASAPSSVVADNSTAYGLFLVASGATNLGTGSLAAVFYANKGYITLDGTKVSTGVASTKEAGTFIKSIGSNCEFKLAIYGAAGGTPTDNLTFNFDRNSSKYVRSVFSTNPQMVNETTVESTQRKSYWLGESFAREVSSLTSAGVGEVYGVLLPLEKGDDNINWSDHREGAKEAYSGWVICQKEKTQQDMFRFKSLHVGEEIEKNYMIAIEQIAEPGNPVVNAFGSFTVAIKNLAGQTIERYVGCNLNPSSPDYLAKRIGDQYQLWSDADRRYRTYGDFQNQSDIIYVDMKQFIKDGGGQGLLPAGFKGPVRPKGFTLLYGSDDVKEFGTNTATGIKASGSMTLVADDTAEVNGLNFIVDDAINPAVTFTYTGTGSAATKLTDTTYNLGTDSIGTVSQAAARAKLGIDAAVTNGALFLTTAISLGVISLTSSVPGSQINTKTITGTLISATPNSASADDFSGGVDSNDFAGAFVKGNSSVPAAGGSAFAFVDGPTNFTASYKFPSIPLRANGIEGGAADPYRAYYGIRPAISSTSTSHDPDYCDYLRRLPADVDSFTPGDDFELSFTFTLDDIIIDTTANTVTYTDGSNLITSASVGASYTTDFSFGALLNKNVRQFLMPIHGGFEGWDITEKEPLRDDLIGTTRNDSTNYLQYTMNKALDSVLDPEVVPSNLLIMPGIKKPLITNRIISVAESRKDTLAIIDLEDDYTPIAERLAGATDLASLGSAASAVSSLRQRNLNSSYAAAFYPWVQISDNLNGSQLVWIPSSVAGLGAMAKSQATSELWFAPAGFNRGGLGSLGGSRGPRVLQARQRLDSKERDSLYEVNINPIATFPAEGVVIFGQKTLQADASALDRINVRRLVLFLKSQVSTISRNLLFDQNVQSTWNRFKSQVNPILSSVKARYGLSDYKLILDDSTTTADLIDRNIMYAKIYIKPARAIEYIVVDFVITKTGADFV